MSVVVKEFPLEEEYKKKNRITKEDVRKLRDWVQNQPHLPADSITDLDLILTYHCCERSAEVSKQVLDLNLTLRTLFGHIFDNRTMDQRHEKAMRTVMLRRVPQRTSEGYAVLTGQLKDVDPKNFDCNALIRCILMLIDLWQYEEGTWPGFVIAVNLEGMALGHLARLDLHGIQQFFYFLQEAMLVKLKSFHFLNAPSFMDRLMMILRPFLKKELLDMLFIHEVGAKTFDKFLPMEHLPKKEEFEDLQTEAINHMKTNAHYFKEESKKRVVESRRPGKPKTITDIFGGIEGSFKKLDID